MEGKSLEDALRRAREEGKFEGHVLSSLSDIKGSLSAMQEKYAKQDAKIENKAEKSDLRDLEKTVAENSRKIYMAVGAIAFFQILISAVGFYLTFIN